MAKSKENPFQAVVDRYSSKRELPQFAVSPQALNELWGGVHLGSMVSLWGEAGTGKSSLAFQVARSLLKQGLSGLYIDVEKAFNPDQQAAFGLTSFVSEGSLVVLTCENMQQLEEIVLSLPGSPIRFVVIDSITMVRAFTPSELRVADVRPGIKALQESTVLSKLKDICYQEEIFALLLSHARANFTINGPFNRYAPDTKQAGGYAISHIPDIVTSITSHGKVKDFDGNLIGVEVTVQTTKNKWRPPFSPCKETLIFGKGIDPRLSLIKSAIEAGVIQHVPGSRNYTLPFEPDTKYNSRTIWELTSDQCRELRRYTQEVSNDSEQ